jgi:hypothetical protein
LLLYFIVIIVIIGAKLLNSGWLANDETVAAVRQFASHRHRDGRLDNLNWSLCKQSKGCAGR